MSWEYDHFTNPQEEQPNPPKKPLLLPRKETNYLEIISKVTSIFANIIIIVFFGISILGLSKYIQRNIGPRGDLQTKISWAKEKEFRNKSKKLEDFAGYEEVKNKIKEEYVNIVNSINNPKEVPSSILLYGPPGTGKTYLAQCLAGEVFGKAPFFITTGSDFTEKYVGVGASRIRELFSAAKKTTQERNQKYFFYFIDEIDAVGRKRSEDNRGSHQEQENTLTTLLTQIDGIVKTEPCAIIIGATNRKELLDEALTRKGCLGKHIHLGLPDAKTIVSLFKAFFKGVTKTVENDFEVLAKILHLSSFTPSDVNAIANEVKQRVKKNKKKIDEITMKEIYDAIDVVLLGLTPTNKSFDESHIKKRVINHELGHAFASKSLGYEVHRVIAAPQGQEVGGYTLSVPKEKLH